MKKILFIIILITSAIHAVADVTASPLDSVNINFEIIDEGVLKANAPTPEYYILEYKGKTAHELYTNVLSAVASIYKNPEKVLNKVEDISISISGTALNVPVKDSETTTFYFAFDYNLQFLFKDGKIKINAPTFDAKHILSADLFTGRYHPVADVFPGMHFHNPNDEFTIAFQSYLNNLIIDIIRKSETINNW